MEFKFSCKWFEIAFSGDPGYVEKLIEKYEPFVSLALTRMKQELTAEEAGPKPSPSPVAPSPGPHRQGPAPSSRPERNPENNRPVSAPPPPASAVSRPSPKPAPSPPPPAPREEPRQSSPERNWRDKKTREQNGGGSRKWLPSWRDKKTEPSPDRTSHPPSPREDLPPRDTPPDRPDRKDPGGPEPLPFPAALAPPGLTPWPTPPALNPAAEEVPDEAAEFQPEELPSSGLTPVSLPEPPNTKPWPPPAGSNPAGLNSHSALDFPARRRVPRILAEELARIMDDKRPRTHHDRVMVFGYYMEHQGGGSDFSTAEVKRCYRAVGQDAGTNIEQVIVHATRSGFVTRFDQGRTVRFKLSSKGRRYVEDGLKLT